MRSESPAGHASETLANQVDANTQGAYDVCMKPIVAYYRVSTQKQGRSGLGLDAQKAAVASYLAGVPHELVGEFVEVESGRRNDRPQLAKAMRLCRDRRATLVIAKLDRLARNVGFISKLMESRVKFIAADMPEANDLVIHIMAAIAQHEHAIISQRTTAAMAQAKARGRKLGWSIPGREHQQRDACSLGTAANRRQADAFAERIGPQIRALRDAGMSLDAIASKLNDRGERPARGASWHATSVRNVLRRLP